MSSKLSAQVARNVSPRLGLPVPLKLLLLTVVLVLCGPQQARAQTPPCPDASTTTFTFTPQAVGDSMTQTINLAPCETIELHESPPWVHPT